MTKTEPPLPPVPPGRNTTARGKVKLVARWRLWIAEQNRAILPVIFAENAPLDLRIVGRTLLHAALVGVAAGLVGAAFFAALEYMQRFLLEDLAGYVPLRARGETFARGRPAPIVFRPVAARAPARARRALLRLLITRSRPRRAAAAATR